MKKEYPLGAKDLFAGFMLRSLDFAARSGYAGLVTMQAWMFLSTYEKLRLQIIDNHHILSMAHLGTNAFSSISGDVVSTTAFVVENQPSQDPPLSTRRTTYIRLVDYRSDAEKESRLVQAAEGDSRVSWKFNPGSQFTKVIPSTPLALWLSEKLSMAFARGSQLKEVAAVKHGMATGKNEAVVRQWWEPSLCRLGLGFASRDDAMESGCAWFPYNSGGKFRKWYGNMTKILRYDKKGQELMASFSGHRHDGRDWYFSPSISWSKVSSGQPAFRSFPAGFVFDVAGASLFCSDSALRMKILSILNSRVLTNLMGAISPTLNFEIGQVGSLPLIDSAEFTGHKLAENAVDTSREDWNVSETSWEFQRNPLITKWLGA